ncbi:DUF748 domain-containing protein [Dyella mobilis]|uniref:DUF748 domain-containing protein n=1 Tax=Dyella mobilis TaxID=1849582 RepID=A0ABS2KKK4_9GAMM|nr:DUF748 domain-containing protein [Dyella mobilis]MBM7131694.1 DUF748 domain-containing protein [Dyella mobilis]GLQ96330.1 hypothetical protein GCM10007863_07480 [Dyella mobilis]
MANGNSPNAFLQAGRERAIGLYRSRGLRITALVIVIFLVLLGLFGFFIAPGIIKSQLEKQLGTQLDRPVTIGAIHVNPYTLRVAVDKFHIGERGGTSSFIDIDNLVVNASWGSLFRLAPVLDELSVVHPQIHIVRTGPQQFNFSDIVQRFANQPANPNASPTRFALSNISVRDGDITLDDKVLNATHRIDQLQIGIPFLANLPHDTDIFVQPLLSMQMDGSPLHIQGQTKPFANSRESVISFNLDHLDLAKYLGYVPEPLPANIPSGLLSGKLDLHFIDTQPTQQLELQGQLQIDNFAMTSHDGAPMLELGHGSAVLDDVQPLQTRYHFGLIQLDQAKLHYAKLPGGHTNFDALLGKDKPPAKPGTPPTDALIAVLALENGAFDYVDRSGPKPAQLTLDNLHGSLRALSTVSAQPATFDITSGLANGNVHATGSLFMSTSRYDGEVSLTRVDLQPLVAMAPPMLNAQIASGSLDGDMHLKVDWSKTLALTMDTSKLALNSFAMEQRDRKPVAWQSLSADIQHLDLGSSVAQLGDVTMQGLKIDARRLKNGSVDLSDLMKSSPSHGKQQASPSWHWSIAHVAVDGSTFALTDPSLPSKDGRIVIDADKFGIDSLSDDMHKPVKLNLVGGIGRGKFHVDGSVKPEPMDADLRIQATRLNVAPFASLVSVPLNVRLDSALLSANGRARYRDRKSAPLISYQGRVVLSRVKVLDKVTNDDFLSWNALSASGMKVRMGEGAPQVDIGGLALNDFYARVIVNANGRINVQDVVSNPAQAPVSVTRAQNGPTPAAPASTPTPTPTPAPAPAAPAPAGSSATLASASTTAAPPAQIHIGQITLANGNLNYTDNFIKPNYTANITQLAGKIGAFGTDTSDKPADVTLQGSLDNNSPVDINGTINPLTPVAFLDIKANANDVELTHLTPYSGKYAGYPITKGRLTMDVHYQLDQGKLNADNHIVLNQLTFGDRIEGPGISHLPVKLAVALLKDSNGNIDIHVPVSGSLNDPHFSLGGVIWQAFLNLIKRAVTAPFRLLAAGMGGGQQDLGYVEFAPGSDVLSKDADDRLAKIVDILNKKPALKLDITGRVDPAFDENGLRTVMVDQAVQKEEADDIGTDAAKAAPAKPGTDDYNKYLAKAYKHAKFKKQRDLVGLTKSQPPDVMTKLMEANVTVDQDALRHLAERRADAVRQYMHGKIDDGRVFVLAPKLDAKGIDDKGKTTRDDFGLH